MRLRLIVVALAAGLLLGACGGAASAAKGGRGTNDPFTLDWTSRWETAALVEQWSAPDVLGCNLDPSACVWNATAIAPSQTGPCLWDIDDAMYFGGFGKLAPGT